MSESLKPEAAPVANDRYKFRPVGSTWGNWGADGVYSYLGDSDSKVVQSLSLILN